MVNRVPMPAPSTPLPVDWTSGSAAVRDRWTLDPGVAYLNHGSFGATPKSVLAAQIKWQEEMEREPVEFLAWQLPSLMRSLREDLAGFLGCDADGLAFVSNATTGVNTVLRSFDWSAGDEIVVADSGYGAVLRSVQHLADRFGVVVRVARLPFPFADLAEIVDAFREVTHAKTRLLIVDQIVSATAVILPVAEIVALAHGFGVPVLVDGAHGPGQLDFSISALQAEFFTGNLHKWLCAPKGSAVLYVSPAWRDRIHPLTLSHDYGKGFRAEFDWTGTADYSAWLACGTALAHFRELGPTRVRESNHELVRAGRVLLAEALGVELPHPDDSALYGSMAAIPFPIPAPDREALRRRMFHEERIEVPFTQFDHRLWVRISGQAYNHPDEYARLAAALHRWRHEGGEVGR